jgi:hypothetical protein
MTFLRVFPGFVALVVLVVVVRLLASVGAAFSAALTF